MHSFLAIKSPTNVGFFYGRENNDREREKRMAKFLIVFIKINKS